MVFVLNQRDFEKVLIYGLTITDAIQKSQMNLP